VVDQWRQLSRERPVWVRYDGRVTYGGSGSDVGEQARTTHLPYPGTGRAHVSYATHLITYFIESYVY